MASVPHIHADAIASFPGLDWRSALATVHRSWVTDQSAVAATRARETKDVLAVPTPYATRISELRRQIATGTYLTDEKIDVVVDRLLDVLRLPETHAPGD